MIDPPDDSATPPDDGGRAGGVAHPADDGYARAWFSLMEHGWRTLAIVPGDPMLSTRAHAAALAAVAKRYSDATIDVVATDATDPASLRAIVAEVTGPRRTGVRMLVALSSPLADAAVIPIARASDACLLVVGLGQTTLRVARDTMDAIGGERFIGSITIAP